MTSPLRRRDRRPGRHRGPRRGLGERRRRADDRHLRPAAAHADDPRRASSTTAAAPSGVLAMIEDVSERRRLEEIRRDFIANVEPRAQDADGRARAARRDPLSSSSDPVGRPAPGRADQLRGVPGQPDHRRPARPVAHRGGGLADARAGRPSSSSSPTPSSGSAPRPTSTTSTSTSTSPTPTTSWSATAASSISARCTRCSRTPSCTRPRGGTYGRASRSTRADAPVETDDAEPRRPDRARRDLRQGRRASPPRTSSGSSSASTASTRAARARPAGPGSACPSCATSRRTTAAASRWSLARARARRSRSAAAARTEPSKSSTEERIQVLLVEDEESFIDALRDRARPRGLRRRRRARRRQTPWRSSTNDTFDLVLLDLMLPKVSGLDVCRQIRARREVPIIVVSAKGEEVDMVLLLEIGADDYVTKPYRLRELVARMRAVLRRRDGHEHPGRRRASRAGPGPPRPRDAALLRRGRARSSCARRSSRCCACCSRTPGWC